MEQGFSENQSAGSRRRVAAWVGAVLAVAASAGVTLLLHTSGRLIIPELAAYYLILVPPVVAFIIARAGRDGGRGGFAQMRKSLPLIALWAGLLALVCSSLVMHPWFYFLDWTRTWFAGFSGPALLALIGAMLAPFFVRGQGKPGRAALALMVACQAVCFAALIRETGGEPLYRDDHPSFMFRHWEFARTFPQLLNYNPYWNGGVTGIVGTTSGTTALGILFWPLWRWMPPDRVYTWIVGAAFIVVVPLIAAASARLAGGGRTEAGVAGILALGVSRHFFLWAMHYGTIGACFSSSCAMLFAACVFRVVFLGRREKWLAAVLVVSAFFLVAWPPGALMALCILAVAAARRRFWSRRNFVFFAGCGLAALVLSSKFLIAVAVKGGDVMGHVLAEAGGAGPATGFDAAAVREFIASGWRHILSQVSEGSPLLIIFGLAGAFFIPYRGVRSWFAPMLVALACLTAWGREWMPNLQLGRMAIPLFYLAVLPASLNIGRLMGLRDFRAAILRATLLAMLILTGWNAAGLYGNGGAAKYVAMPQQVHELIDWIRDNVPGGGRVMFAGRVVHAMGRGHVAPLPIFTGREMMACDYYHFPPQMVEYDFPPRCFRHDVPGFCELYNVTHVLTYHENWKAYFRSMPERFEEIRDFDIFTMFRARRESALFLRGGGAARAGFNSIIVRPDNPDVEQVVKYNWADGLEAEPPARVYPVAAADGVEFIGIAPGGAGEVRIKFRSRL